MNEFDVIVIGAGPAGCYAALSAAARGCTVALFEEHSAIGWPRHDPGWLMASDFSESIIGSMGASVPWARVKEYRVCHAESGELIEASTRAGFIVRRDLLEKELASLAVKAGARLYLKTRVVNIIKTGDTVEGIETNSRATPEARARIIICADGIRSASHGFAAKEALCKSTDPKPGISYLLANADVAPGVIEHFMSPDPLLNYKTFFTHGDGLSIFSMLSAAAFHDLRERKDNVVSRKIANACPLEISGFARTSAGKYGDYFSSMISGNIIFVGDASGGAGNIHGMIQGQMAATVAASALRDKDTGKERLSEYHELVRSTLAKAPFFYFSARKDFSSFENWFREVEEATQGLTASECSLPFRRFL
ncbi:MAG TPA: NAD(P)/FAD-dependent oxidoreductase [Syntrophorhabdales bacterium]|nr:NAD(P)/FAD-dependent oxidoreductase [Syntrophorhabdales bacterium]